MSLKTPVAFLIFNRPHLTERVFQAIAEAQPAKLLVVADGPRNAEEALVCEQTRKIIQVDWDCEVITNFADTNLGCRERVSSGISWIFSQVDEAIILEDDCLPAPSFFGFCESLLEKYRHDERIMHIGGTNLQGGHSRTSFSYYFSRYIHVWGWATWRRAWQYYDVEMRNWPQDRELIGGSLEDPVEAQFWLKEFDQVCATRFNTWDFQWVYACWSQSGLSVIPDVNLVSNLGFGPDATHTHEHTPNALLPLSDIWQVNHPPSVIRDHKADAYTFDHSFDGIYLRQPAQRVWQVHLRRIKGLARRALHAGRILRRMSH